MVAIYWFYMYLTRKSYRRHAGFGFTRNSYVLLFTKVVPIVRISFQILYFPCSQKLILKRICCLNKTITTLNHSVITAGWVKCSF